MPKRNKRGRAALLPLLAVAAVIGVTTGCAGSGTDVVDAGPGTDNGDTEALLSSLVSGVCEAVQRCQLPFHVTLESCEDGLDDMWGWRSKQLRELRAALGSGRLRIDEALWADCVAAVRDMPCGRYSGTEGLGAVPACVQMIVPVQRPGASCDDLRILDSYVSECVNGLCDTSTSPATCDTYADLGEACGIGTYGICNRDVAYCDPVTSVCTATMGEGASCSPGSMGCGIGLVCILANQTCEPPRLGGEACGFLTDCMSGVCVDGTCRDESGPGEPCLTPAQCGDGLLCVGSPLTGESTCQEGRVGSEGDDCSAATTVCDVGLTCKPDAQGVRRCSR